MIPMPPSATPVTPEGYTYEQLKQAGWQDEQIAANPTWVHIIPTQSQIIPNIPPIVQPNIIMDSIPDNTNTNTTSKKREFSKISNRIEYFQVFSLLLYCCFLFRSCFVLVVFVLNIKDKLQEYESQVSRQDLNQAILFMMMTFVILPILPNSAVDQWGLFNLYQIWLMVVLIAGISFFGYICTRFFGSQKGLGVTGFFGGLVSSTAIAYNMSRQVKTNLVLSKNFAIAVMLASSFPDK